MRRGGMALTALPKLLLEMLPSTEAGPKNWPWLRRLKASARNSMLRSPLVRNVRKTVASMFSVPGPENKRRAVTKGDHLRTDRRVIACNSERIDAGGQLKSLRRSQKATFTRPMSAGTSINGPTTPTKASPEFNPKTATDTAIASSKLLPAAVNAKVADCA